MVERSHRQVKDALRARLAGNEWPLHLPWVLLGLRSAPKEDSNVSSAKLVYGAALTLPGQIVTEAEKPPEAILQQLCQQPSLPTRPLSYAKAAAAVPSSSAAARG